MRRVELKLPTGLSRLRASGLLNRRELAKLVDGLATLLREERQKVCSVPPPCVRRLLPVGLCPLAGDTP